MQDRMHQDGPGGLCVGALPRRQLVKHRSGSEDVDPGIDPFSQDLLGSHVGERSLHHARRGLSDIDRVRQQFGDAEIEDLESAVGRQTEVSRLEVSMEDALLVRSS